MANEVYFMDIMKTGKDYTGKKDISILTNEQAVLEAVMNILNTEPGTRVMNPEFGCNLEKFLFDSIDPITGIYIKEEIEKALNTFEQRIENLVVDVIPDEDNNTFEINIYFNMKVLKTQQNVSFTLDKIR